MRIPIWSCTLLLYSLLFAGNLLAEEITWIDVRTAEEFNQAHLPGAQNIEYGQISSDIARLGLEHDAVIYLYCRSGHRAGIAKQTLESLGYTRVENIGGLDDAVATAKELDKD